MLKSAKDTASWERSTGRFSVIEVPAIIMSVETFVRMQKEAEKMFGFEGASVLFYETGKKSGEQWIKRFSREWELDDQRFIQAVQDFYAELGWGNFNITNGNEIVVKVEHSFIARGYGSSDRASCHFLRGYNAGLAEALSGKSIDAEEVRCATKGDGYCEFVMTYIE